MNRCCLIVIFNHRYDKNLVKIRELYKDRFKDIFVVMPFYDGDSVEGLTIIPVFENSYYFSGYVAQAYETIKQHGEYTHYVVIGDDLVLNPRVNENNVAEILNLTESDSYIKSLIPLSKARGLSSIRVYNEILAPFWKYNGVEFKNEILSCEEARKVCDSKQIQYDTSLDMRWVFGQICTGKVDLLRLTGRSLYALRLLLNKGKGLPYPFFESYSDFFVISGNDMARAAHYFGVLAAMGVFVEIAVPTAMAIVCNHVVTKDRLSIRCGEMWTEKEKIEFDQRYSFSINRLYDEWDDSVLYYHPVKLSKWKFDGR